MREKFNSNIDRSTKVRATSKVNSKETEKTTDATIDEVISKAIFKATTSEATSDATSEASSKTRTIAKGTFRQEVMQMVAAGKYQLGLKFGENYRPMVADGECPFLDFIKRTSRFGWDNKQSYLSPYYDALGELHTLSKLCALGYLLSDVRDIIDRKLIVAVNSNNKVCGGTGKSLFIRGVESFYSSLRYWFDLDFQAYRKTRLKNHDFLILEGSKPFKIDKYIPYLNDTDHPIHFYLETNQDISKQLHENSDNTITLFFSDYYNCNRRVNNDLGRALYFGDDAPMEERRTLQMLLSDCILLYREYGLIQAPEFYLHRALNHVG